jgi:hypothetical protein
MTRGGKMVQQTDQVKHLADAAAYGTVFAAWLGVFSTALTIIATIAAIVWTCIRIYETQTVQDWLRKK